MRLASLLIGALCVCIVSGCGKVSAPNAASVSEACGPGADSLHWLGAWSAAPSDVGDVFTDQTLRVVISPRFHGDTLRIRLSNRFGTQPINFANVSIGLQGAGASLMAGSLREVTFNCASKVTLAPGQELVSDPVGRSFQAFENLGISLHMEGSTGAANRHALGLQTSYVAAPAAGDQTGVEAGDAFTTTTTFVYFLQSIEVVAAREASAIVAFGDSITDGTVSTGGVTISPDLSIVDRNQRYPDFLARRLNTSGLGDRFSILNAGIAGNRLLSDAFVGFPRFGPSGLSRADADVIAQAGVSDVIVMLGGNDLGLAPPATADEVIAGLQQLIDRLHAAGLNVIVGTQTPAFGVIIPGGHGLPYAVLFRNQTNDWIRNESNADGVVDFHALLRDPANPDALNPLFDSGDHLHPNVAGYEAMANFIDLGLFRGAGR